jgi:type VI secretion system protein ImpB
MDNIQHLLDKVRSPRVQITYDVETNGAKVIKEIPYVLAIIGDIVGHTEKIINYYERKFINLKPENFNEVMKFLGVKLNISLNKYSLEKTENPEAIELSLPLENIHDFHPDNIVNNWSVLKDLKNKLVLFKDFKRKINGNNILMQSILGALKNNTLNSSMTKSSEEESKDSKKDDKSTKDKSKEPTKDGDKKKGK